MFCLSWLLYVCLLSLALSVSPSPSLEGVHLGGTPAASEARRSRPSAAFDNSGVTFENTLPLLPTPPGSDEEEHGESADRWRGDPLWEGPRPPAAPPGPAGGCCWLPVSCWSCCLLRSCSRGVSGRGPARGTEEQFVPFVAPGGSLFTWSKKHVGSLEGLSCWSHRQLRLFFLVCLVCFVFYYSIASPLFVE